MSSPDRKTKKKKTSGDHNYYDEDNHVMKKKKKSNKQNSEDLVMEDNDLDLVKNSYDVDVDADDAEVVNPTLAEAAKEEEVDSWSKEDYHELFRKMEELIPKKDSLSFTCRAERLDWDKIAFGEHSREECHEKWKKVRLKVRHYRLLHEVLQDARAWAENPWTFPRRSKKVRHPDQPTRPLTSFMLFFMDKKNKMIKRHPEMKLTDISKHVGEKYNALTEEKKQKYVTRAKIAQDEYKENLAKFYKKYPEYSPANKRSPAKPKNVKPLQPSKLYVKEKLEKHKKDEGFNKNEYQDYYKRMWKTLKDKKKAFWIRMAKEKEDEYLDRLRERDDDEGGVVLYKSVLSKDDQAILDRLAGKPEKPPNSAYSLYSRLLLQDKKLLFVEGEPKNRMKEIAKMWKEVPEDQKKEYQEKVHHMHENYKLEMANYLDTLPEDKRREEMAKLQPQTKKKVVKSKVSKKASATKSREDAFKHEPEKPPVTAWDLFKTEYIKKNSHLPSKVACTQASDKWKNMDKKEADKYKKQHEQLKAKYMADFEAFLASLNEEELKDYSCLKTAKAGSNEAQDEEETSSDSEDDSSSSSSDSSGVSDSGVSEDDS